MVRNLLYQNWGGPDKKSGSPKSQMSLTVLTCFEELIVFSDAQNVLDQQKYRTVTFR